MESIPAFSFYWLLRRTSCSSPRSRSSLARHCSPEPARVPCAPPTEDAPTPASCFVVITVLWTIATVIGLLFWTYPGLLILALTPYVVIAAADGHEHPVRANFQAIKFHFGRYVGLLLVTVVLLFADVSGQRRRFTFFVDGAPAAFLIWLYLGFIGCWLMTGWVLLWRSTPPGQESASATD